MLWTDCELTGHVVYKFFIANIHGFSPAALSAGKDDQLRCAMVPKALDRFSNRPLQIVGRFRASFIGRLHLPTGSELVADDDLRRFLPSFARRRWLQPIARWRTTTGACCYHAQEFHHHA